MVGDDGGEADVTLGGPATRHAFFCEKTERVYVSPPPAGVPAAPILAPAVAAAAGLPDDVVARLAGLLAAPRDRLAAAAAAMGCVAADGVDRDGTDADEESVESARGEPGAPVLARDAALLRARPTRPFVAGDVYAVRVDETTTGASPASSRDYVPIASASGFVYARAVTSARPAPGEAVTRVTVEVGPGKTRDLLTSEVFSFAAAAAEENRETASSDAFVDGVDSTYTSASPGGASSSATSDANRRPVVEMNGDGVSRESSGARASIPSSSSSSSSSGVTPEELASAVREMLIRAGAPPTLDQTAMLAAHGRLRDRLSAAVAAAAGAEKDRSDAFAAADAASRAFHCPITQARMSDPVVALDGHTYERRAIEQWFSQGRLTSPVTNLRLPATTLVPNHALKSAADALENSVLGTDAPSRER